MTICPTCKGHGWIVEQEEQNLMRGVFRQKLPHTLCPDCQGSGEYTETGL